MKMKSWDRSSVGIIWRADQLPLKPDLHRQMQPASKYSNKIHRIRFVRLRAFPEKISKSTRIVTSVG